MTALQQFIAYATAFEQTYDDDDWSRIEPFFAPDAVYEVQGSVLGCRLEGRPAILAGLKKSLDGFDRRFAKRTLDVVDGPHEQGDTVTIGWTATYAVPGATSLLLRGRSTVSVRDGKVVRLVDAYPDGMDEEVAGWLARHAPGCSASYV